MSRYTYVEEMLALEQAIKDAGLSEAATTILTTTVREVANLAFTAGHTRGYELGRAVYKG